MPPAPVQVDNGLLAINALVSRLAQQIKLHQKRRTDVRYEFGSRALVLTPRTAHLQPICEAWCLDISYQGAGLIVGQEILVGREIAVQFSDGPTSFHVAARVLRCAPMLSWMCHLGVLFLF